MPGRACRRTAGIRILVVRVCLPGAGRRGPAPPRGVEIPNQATREPGLVSEADTGTAAPGTVFNGRYEIVEPISSGAMGAVYRAIDRAKGGEVALKRLLDLRNAARFEIEARLLSSLSHPRVVKVLDHSQDDEGLYIIMELVRGTDLGEQ